VNLDTERDCDADGAINRDAGFKKRYGTERHRRKLSAKSYERKYFPRVH
jgi:hypothetical protein